MWAMESRLWDAESLLMYYIAPYGYITCEGGGGGGNRITYP